MHHFPIFLIIFVLAAFTFLPLINFTLASNGSGGTPGGGSGGSPGELQNPIGYSTFEELISAILGWLNKVLIPVAAIMIFYAGFLYITAAGNPEKIKKAHSAITWALVGIAIVLLSTGLSFVIRDVITVR